ncbi:MAG: response regulator [Deltaproteobacteria bacterium]|nr:response regulator [Deltaproteobacteria bacterium]
MSQRKVLYLEDDPGAAELAREALAQSGADTLVDIASEREEFLEACDRHEYDLILSDHTVPGFSGLAALEHARKTAPETPFVFLCATHGKETELRCFEAGANDFVRKDELWKLPVVVKRLLEERDRHLREQAIAERDRGLTTLVQATQELGRCRSLDQVGQVVRRFARELSGADSASFVLLDGDQCFYLEEDPVSPLWKGSVPRSRSISGWAMQHNEHVAIEDVQADARVPLEEYQPALVKSLMMMPVGREQPVAAIGTYWSRPHKPAEQEIGLLQSLADTTAVALETVALLNEQERRVRERAAQLEAQTRDLEAYGTAVSHDLRNPLGQVIGFADLLKSDTTSMLSPNAKRYVDRILTASHRMNGLIGELLQLNSLSRATLTVTRLDLGAMARQIMAEQDATHVRFELEDGLVADGDAGLMKIVLEHLLSNAVKFSQKRADAAVKLGTLGVAGRQRTFYVRDNGVGFDPATAQRLFTPFGRLHAAKDFPGAGIGLATAQRILHRHGGRIWAEASPGQGATFSFSLPVT